MFNLGPHPIIYLHSHHPDILLRPWNASTLLSWYLVANLPLNCSAHLIISRWFYLSVKMAVRFVVWNIWWLGCFFLSIAKENGIEICCLENVTLQSCQISSRLVTHAILFWLFKLTVTRRWPVWAHFGNNDTDDTDDKNYTCLGTFRHCSCFSVSHFSIGTFWQSCLTRENHYGMSI